MVETINKLIRVSRQLLQELGREPTPEEIAAEMNMPVERVREILKISQEPVSLETPIGEEEDSHLGDFIQDDNVEVPADAATYTLLHELTYRRTNRNIHVYGYQEEGTITTPFDMRVQNEIDRFHLVKHVIQYLPQLGNRGSYLVQQMNDKLVEHKQYIHEYGQDLPEVRDWKWNL